MWSLAHPRMRVGSMADRASRRRAKKTEIYDRKVVPSSLSRHFATGTTAVLTFEHIRSDQITCPIRGQKTNNMMDIETVTRF